VVVITLIGLGVGRAPENAKHRLHTWHNGRQRIFTIRLSLRNKSGKPKIRQNVFCSDEKPTQEDILAGHLTPLSSSRGLMNMPPASFEHGRLAQIRPTGPAIRKMEFT